jgi:hypothetical protein
MLVRVPAPLRSLTARESLRLRPTKTLAVNVRINIRFHDKPRGHGNALARDKVDQNDRCFECDPQLRQAAVTQT